MEFNGFVILAIVWFVVSLISQAGKKSQGQRRAPQPQPSPRPRDSSGLDPSQQEGTRLELVLRQVQRALEDAATEGGVRTSPQRHEEMEEARSLELEPEVTSLEKMAPRARRQEVDQDDQAEQVAARRIKAASARDVAYSAVARPKVDERIQQQAADHTATAGYTAKQLRDAIVWREILDPPVSLRWGTDRDS
jgi:hypothetical protein